MRRTLAAAAVAALSFTLPAQAETIDLATVKCSELATMDQDSATFMFTWLLGYASGQAGTTTMDLAAAATAVMAEQEAAKYEGPPGRRPFAFQAEWRE